MTVNMEASLVMQREKLQQQLQQQRKLIAQQLLPHSAGGHGYPRSMTMRFLLQRPKTSARIFTEIMALFAGARLFKLLGVLLTLVRILHASSANTQQRLSVLPAPENKYS